MAGIIFSGLGSGLDIGKIVDQLIAVDSVPIKTIQKKQDVVKLQKELMNEINSSLLELQKSLKNVSDTLLKGSCSVTSSNETVLGVSVSSNAVADNYNIKVSQLAQNLIVSGDKIVGPINKSGSVTLNDGTKDLEIIIDVTDTVDTIAKKINDTNSNIRAYTLDGQLVLSHSKMGEGNTFSITQDANGIFTALGIINADNSFKTIAQKQQNALFSVNGIGVTKSSNNISDLIAGVTLNLKSTGESQISISDNIDAMVKTITDFISKYNDTVRLVDAKLSEAVPKEITSANKKQGLLKGDRTLSQIKTKLRQSTFGKIINSGSFEYLRQIGLDISSDNFGKSGTLQLVDESKLSDALKNNRANTINLFIQDVDGDKNVSSGDKGLLGYLNTYIDGLSFSSSSKKGSIVDMLENFDKQIKSYDKDIEKKEAQIEFKRLRYEKQFAAMDARVSSLTANGDYLINSLNSMMN